ncbi:motility associated factor glycosyltransferase family protein [Clostridium oryzae]|uniref:6-hydroxymethylpterin diphosphokinase MptE-like domain-containing protein n=1 Tax=Clostridium oryzae TaxID=1450648 RepID=A0A1V4ILV9_9CLOT|nr:6-hydroxymethylpterin diphosphokinase MptE-like protein [Clostridium oryzae]OPJ60883.1 hypothetical protein CLORY_25900 [Clostridium oryzae]
MNFFENNIELLRKKGNINLKHIDRNDNYSCDTANDGQKIIKVNKNGKEIYLGSKYNNKSLIDKFLRSYDLEDGDAMYVVIGFGTGYHIEELLNKSQYNKIIVLESDINIIRTACEERDLRKILTNPRVLINTYSNESQIIDIFEKEVDRSYPNYIYYNFYANYDKLYQQEIDMAARTVKFVTEMMIASAETNLTFKNKVLDNYFKNIKTIARSVPTFKFYQKFKGTTAVVVSSGPSLKKNINVLKKYQNKAIIICAARSLKELLDNGVRPDFVCAVDPGGIMEQLMGPVMEENIPMACFEQLNSHLVERYKGKKIFFLNHLISSFSYIFNVKFDSLPVGGSVAHLCSSLAGYMGAKNIVFVGQDLAYTDNKYHSDSSSNEKLIGQVASINRAEAFYVEGNVEEKVLTSRSLSIFRKWFEMFIRTNSNIRFINCTEGGAKIQGTEIMSLEEFFNSNSGEDETRDKERILSILSEKVEPDYSSIIKKMQQFRDKLVSMRDKALDGVKNADILLQYYKDCKKKNINSVLKKLDDIDLLYAKEEEILYLINLCAYEYMKSVVLNKETRTKNFETERDKGIRIATRNICIYKGYAAGIDVILGELDYLLEDMKKEKEKYAQS